MIFFPFLNYNCHFSIFEIVMIKLPLGILTQQFQLLNFDF